MLMILHRWNSNRSEWQRCESKFVETENVDLRAVAADYLVTTRATDNAGYTTTIGPHEPVMVELSRMDEPIARIETHDPCMACYHHGPIPEHAPILTGFSGNVVRRVDYRQALTRSEIRAAETRATRSRVTAGSGDED